MLEYVLAFASLVLLSGILWCLVRGEQKHAVRTENLVTLDCP